MKPNIAQTLRTQAVEQALQTVERRVNALGVSEPIVAPYGTAGDQILVQLPGVNDPDQVKRLIGTTALLELKIVEGGPAASQEALLQSTGGVAPPEMEVVTGADRTNPGSLSYYLVRKVAPVTGRDLSNARASVDENNLPAVAFSMNRAGAIKFGNLTGENIGKPMAVILDGRVETVATIQGRITDNGQIFGSFTAQDVADMSLMLRSGALPAGLTYLEERTVGPTLGADSIRAGVTASLGGLLLVALFMLVYYKLSGINAILSIVLNLLILLAFMAMAGAVMTLPGVAGFILTIGMGVDSNVLIFERIKEELAAGKGPRAAVSAGFDRVFWTIVDTHIASLVAAAFLFQFGTGPIRGFATTLFFGLLSNVFTAVFVSRTLVRVHPVAARAAAVAEHLVARLRRTTGHADLLQHALRLHQVALARHRPVRAGHPRRRRDGRRNAGCRSASTSRAAPSSSSSSRSRSARTPSARRSTRVPGEKVVQQYGKPEDAQHPRPAAAAAGRRRGLRPRGRTPRR